uniref:DUF1685 domain-containing protein n=1 Tax=Opuntia streptacantha TaxID=393608 RepID=A0A7C8ZX26_OPUST
MEAEAVLNLLDSYWYDLDFFKRKPSSSSTRSCLESHPVAKIPEKPSSNPELPSLPTIHTKSPSQKAEKITPISQQRSDSASPNSVLLSPKLQTIFSGKESKEFEDSRGVEKEFQETPTNSKGSPLKGTIGMRRKKKGGSKSLSDLEFQELKGFMDLGFVFSEEDKDSTLASIIPGLQRLGKKSEAANNGDFVDDDKKGDESERLAVPRPYLSESWEVMERKRRENSLLNWKVPTSHNDIDMKDYLRFWAHTVAATYR